MTGSFEGRYQDDDVAGAGIQADGSILSLGKVTKTFLPRVALTYTPADDFTIYGQIAMGNNPAGVNTGALDENVIAAASAFPEFFPTDLEGIAFFQEEEVLSIELGIKGSYDDRMTYAVNLYHLDWENYTQAFNLNFEPDDFIDLNDDGTVDAATTYSGLDFGIGRSFLGAGNVTGTGIELESSFIVSDNLRVGLNASYIDITYDDGACSTVPENYGVVPNTVTAIGLPCVEVAGNEIGTQPNLAAALSVDYSLPLSNGMEWFTRWSTQYTSAQYVTEKNLAELGAYSISDLRSGLSTDNWRAELYVTNIFDEDAPQGPQIFHDGSIGGPPPVRQNAVYTARRGTQLGLRFSYNFGG